MLDTGELQKDQEAFGGASAFRSSWRRTPLTLPPGTLGELWHLDYAPLTGGRHV